MKSNDYKELRKKDEEILKLKVELAELSKPNKEENKHSLKMTAIICLSLLIALLFIGMFFGSTGFIYILLAVLGIGFIAIMSICNF